jgi:hypothetical protein
MSNSPIVHFDLENHTPQNRQQTQTLINRNSNTNPNYVNFNSTPVYNNNFQTHPNLTYQQPPTMTANSIAPNSTQVKVNFGNKTF